MKIRALAASLMLAALGMAPARAADPMSSLRYLVGTWTCTYRAGSQRVTYQATFAYSMDDNWMQERDARAGGVGGEALITDEPKARTWTEAVFENKRTTTAFRARGPSSEHIVYRSILPNINYTDVLDRVSPTSYTLHFTQEAGGETTKPFDTCSKSH